MDVTATAPDCITSLLRRYPALNLPPLKPRPATQTPVVDESRRQIAFVEKRISAR